MMIFRILKGWPRFQLLEVVSVGLPFCGFKLLTGAVLLRHASGGVVFHFSGAVLMILGAVDLLINLLNGLSLLSKKRRAMDACLLAVFSRLFGRRSVHPQWAWQDFGNSVDVLLCFALVAAVVGLGVMKSMSPEQVALWNLCVVFNVLGAGLSRFGSSLKNFLQPGR